MLFLIHLNPLLYIPPDTASTNLLPLPRTMLPSQIGTSEDSNLEDSFIKAVEVLHREGREVDGHDTNAKPLSFREVLCPRKFATREWLQLPSLPSLPSRIRHEESVVPIFRPPYRMKHSRDRLNSSLIGRLGGTPIPTKILHSKLPILWRQEGNLEIVELPNQFYLFKLGHE